MIELRTRHRVRPLGQVLRTGILLAALTLPTIAVAETSSWSDRMVVAPKDKSVPKDQAPAGVFAPVKPKTVRTAPATRPPASSSESEHEKTSAGEIEEAAYFAFDQGRYLTALDLAQKAARKGDPQAHTLIGRIYEEGYGVPMDTKGAAQWYAKGAELGDMEAIFALGVLSVEGRGMAKDDSAAARYFETAAAKGHALANYNLALLFLKGSGKPENPHRGFMHMRYAAEQGVVAAQYDLGTLYATGIGVDPNAFEAAKWIGKAANAGHTEATLEYAVLLFKGHGVPPDQKRGADLFRSAAEKGIAAAQNRLARCYAHGAGVAKSPKEAAKWHLIAKAGGVEDEQLDKLLAGLPRSDRLAAEKAASEWRERALVQ